MNFRSTAFAAAAVAAAAFLSQVPAFAGTLIWDDVMLVRPGGMYVTASRFQEALSSPLGGETFYWRPVATTSLLLDSLVHGLDASGFRVTNALLHAATSAAACVLLLRLLPSRTAAVVAALAWALHPLHVETVTWISARFDLLGGLFALLALLATETDGATPARLAACGAAVAAACLSKESGFVLPVVVWAWVVARGRADASFARPTRFAVAAAVGVGVVWLLRLRVLGYVLRARSEAVADAGDALQHLLLVGRAVATDVVTFLFPWGTVGPMHFAERPIPPSDALGWTGVALAAALVVAIALAWRRGRASPPLLVAAVAAAAPASQIVPLDVGGGLHTADRFLYLPAFFVVAAVAAAACAIAASQALRRVGVWAGAVLVAALAAGRLAIVPRWNDGVRFWTWAVEMAPTNALARVNLAYGYFWTGRLSEAEIHARMVPPADETVLADVLEAQGRLDEAVQALGDVLRVRPGEPGALIRRAQLHLRAERWREAIGDYDAVVRTGRRHGAVGDLNEQRAMAGVAEAVAHLDPAAARSLVERAEAAAVSDDASTWLHLSRARLAIGDADGAARALDRAAAYGADAASVQTLRQRLDSILVERR